MRGVVPLFLALVCFLIAPAAHARDGFVHAGESGGDGSRQKPFGDPWMRNGAVDLAKGGVLRNCLIVNSSNAVRTSPGRSSRTT